MVKENEKIEESKVKPSLYNDILELSGNDTIQIFGESGTGKTTFALKVAQSFVKNKKKVLFLDTERNLIEVPKDIDYKWFPSFTSVHEFICGKDGKGGLGKGKEKYDLIIMDSMGLPILGEFASLGMKDRGEILLKSQEISYKLKQLMKDC